MEEKNLSGEESLKLIHRMIYEAKGYFYETGLSDHLRLQHIGMHCACLVF